MTPKKAAQILGLVTIDGLSADDVRAAFAAAAKSRHPDLNMTSDGKEPFNQFTLAQTKRARDILLARVAAEARQKTCPACDGRGVSKSRRGFNAACATCGGDGVVINKETRNG